MIRFAYALIAGPVLMKGGEPFLARAPDVESEVTYTIKEWSEEKDNGQDHQLDRQDAVRGGRYAKY